MLGPWPSVSIPFLDTRAAHRPHFLFLAALVLSPGYTFDLPGEICSFPVPRFHVDPLIKPDLWG